MAEKLCSLRKKGGNLSETVLWTNASPTSAFAGQNVSLSDNVNNYKYIEIQYDVYASQNHYMSSIYKVSELLSMNTPSSNDNYWRTDLSALYQNYVFTRLGYLYDNTHFHFDNNLWVLSSGTVQRGTNNSSIIPIKIIGLK